MRLLSFAAQMVVAIALIASGIAHISNPYIFLESVLAYQIFPREIVPWLVAIITYVVMFSGLAVLTGLFRPQVYALTTALFLAFVVMQVSVLFRGMEIGCGCFGPSEHALDWRTVGSSFLLLLSSFAALMIDKKESTSIHAS